MQVPAPQAQAGGGVDTGTPQAPQYDAQKRPITAGGFVQSGPVVFEDISEKAGLTHWTHKMGTPAKKYISRPTGRGSAWSTTTTTGGSISTW